jgi:hypothetical protein
MRSKTRRGKPADGQADIAAASAIRPQIASAFEKRGIAP